MSRAYQSRLTRTQERRTKKQIALSLLGIFAILILFYNLIPQLVGSISDLFPKKEKETTKIDKNILVLAPIIDPLPQATSSSKVLVFGNSYEIDNATVEVYLNGKKEEELLPNPDGKFEAFLNLVSGENTIKARVRKDGKTSNFSDEAKVYFINEPPLLEISTPTDLSSFSKDDKEVKIKGKTEPENKITVNGYQTVVDFDGSFSYSPTLKEGENEITIEAENQAGLKTSKTIKVTYSP